VQIEVHLPDKYLDDFHGVELRVMVTGFIRAAMKFASLPALVDRFHQDISVAKVQLQHETSMAWRVDTLPPQSPTQSPEPHTPMVIQQHPSWAKRVMQCDCRHGASALETLRHKGKQGSS
jgi:hypothetical protein